MKFQMLIARVILKCNNYLIILIYVKTLQLTKWTKALQQVKDEFSNNSCITIWLFLKNYNHDFCRIDQPHDESPVKYVANKVDV
jgi:hypothetical protein